MGIPVIHPNWSEPAEVMTDGFSLEITAKDVDALREASPKIPGEHPVAITFLPGEDFAARIAATRTVRELGFEPMPHFSARRIRSAGEFQDYLAAVVEQAGVRRCFVVAGDPATAYELQTSTDLKTWAALATVTTDDTGNVVFTDADSAAALARETWAEGNRFYRAVVAPDDGGE